MTTPAAPEGTTPAPTHATEEPGFSQPESTTVAKLFVGQVPNLFSETDIKTVFDPYGNVTDVFMLRDKFSGQPKGCAFVTFDSHLAANKAIDALHGKHTLHESKRPMVVRYSGQPPGEEQDAKLFVGMLSRSTSKEAIEQLFSPFGHVIEVYLMKDTMGRSKGCCFVKYSSRESANKAIAALHIKHTDGDSPEPLQVKYANSKKDKAAQQPQVPFHNPYGAIQMAMMGMGGMPGLGLGVPQMFGAGAGGLGGMGSYGYPGQDQGQNAYGAPSNPYAAASASAYAQPAAAQGIYGATAGYGASSAIGAGGMGGMGMGGYGGAAVAGGGGGASGGARGPPGSNLFVYNVPESYSDNDLSIMFSNFGTVVSASIFRDKMSGLSKGFGFVSYSDAPSAQKAIAALNGFAIGDKRLKVQLKKGEPGSQAQQATARYTPY